MADRLAYTVEEVADLLGVHVATVRKAIERGDLAAVRIGGTKVPGKPGRPPGRLLVPADALRALLDRGAA